MRTVGLLGGMSWQSTQSYYQLINEDVQSRKGGLHSAPLLIKSFDFAEIETLQVSGQWATAGRLLSEQAVALQEAGAEAIALATNTMHKLAGDIVAAVSVPFMHIADATAQAVLASLSRRPLLLATAFTMEQNFYTAPLNEALEKVGGIVHIPEAQHRQIVHQVIYEELCKGIIDARARAAYQKIIRHEAKTKGCDGVILGCTEIGLLISQNDIDLPVFDTTTLHCEQITDFICKDDSPALMRRREPAL